MYVTYIYLYSTYWLWLYDKSKNSRTHGWSRYILDKYLDDTANAAEILENVSKKIGVLINIDRTKIMELIKSKEGPKELDVIT